MNTQSKLFTIHPKKLFLMDSLGALLSVLLLGLVLTNFESLFGVPQSILYLLSAIALCLSIYSFICYWHFKPGWRAFMKGIAFANLAYLALTATLLLSVYGQVTLLGITYFILEALIIFFLVFLELKTAFNKLEK